MTIAFVGLVCLLVGFTLGAWGTALACRLCHKAMPQPVEYHAPTYDEMKRDIAITDADHIMRIGTA